MAAEDSDDVWSNRVHPIREDMAFQRSQWAFERGAWCGLYCVILLALLGLFSAGPLSAIRLGDVDTRLQIDFQRFHRSGGLTDMTLFLMPGNAGIATLSLNSSFLEAFAIEDLQPSPVLSRSSPEGINFVFDAGRGELMPVYFSLRPRHIGPVPARLSLNDHQPIEVTLFIYP